MPQNPSSLSLMFHLSGLNHMSILKPITGKEYLSCHKWFRLIVAPTLGLDTWKEEEVALIYEADNVVCYTKKVSS